MRFLKYAGLSAAFLGILFLTAGSAQAAQVAVGVRVGPVGVAVGPEPVCAYGYYAYYPYACAPVGYWAPNYFVGGMFIGAGPWFHGWGHPYGWYVRPGYAYRPGWAYRPGPVYRGAPAHGFVGGHEAWHGNAGGFRGGEASHGGGGYHGGGFHGGGRGR